MELIIRFGGGMLLVTLVAMGTLGVGMAQSAGGASGARSVAGLDTAKSISGADVMPFSGTWKLNVARSKVQAKHAPQSSTAWIGYDGRDWHYKRTHVYAGGKNETWSIDLAVGSPLTHMEIDGPLTFYSKIRKEMGGLVLTEDITANNGEKAKNTVHYSLADGGKTLLEVEHEETPAGNEVNRWVFTRE